jgi:hypothetical protein
MEVNQTGDIHGVPKPGKYTLDSDPYYHLLEFILNMRCLKLLFHRLFSIVISTFESGVTSENDFEFLKMR